MSCPISWSIIIKREITKARTIFCFSPSLLCKIAMRHVRSAVESGSVAYSNITAVSHEYFGLTAIQYRTSGPRWLRNIEIDPILTARDGLPNSITQNNPNAAARGLRPNVTNGNSIYVANPYPNGT